MIKFFLILVKFGYYFHFFKGYWFSWGERERERERSQIDPHPPPPGEFQYVFSLASQIRFLFFKNFSFRFSCGFEFFYNKMEANQHLSEIIKA